MRARCPFEAAQPIAARYRLPTPGVDEFVHRRVAGELPLRPMHFGLIDPTPRFGLTQARDDSGSRFFRRMISSSHR
jgi:hypothetical protein